MYYNNTDPATEKVIVLDMDGTLADLYADPDWLSKLRAENPAPYAEAAAMWDMTELARTLEQMQVKGWRVVIVSWLSKEASPMYAMAIRRAKREWLADWQVPWDEAHFVRYGSPKSRVVKNLPAGSWLVDDDRKVREAWEHDKGRTIDPTATDDLPALLKKMFLADNPAD